MSGDPSPAAPASRLLPAATVVLSVLTILGSVVLRGFTLPLGLACFALGLWSFNRLRNDPDAQGIARGAVAAGVSALLIGVGWIILTAVVTVVPAGG